MGSFDILLSETVHRYYESRRRLFNDEQPARKAKAMEARKKARKNFLRRQVNLQEYYTSYVQL